MGNDRGKSLRFRHKKAVSPLRFATADQKVTDSSRTNCGDKCHHLESFHAFCHQGGITRRKILAAFSEEPLSPPLRERETRARHFEFFARPAHLEIKAPCDMYVRLRHERVYSAHGRNLCPWRTLASCTQMAISNFAVSCP
jgi:hypothetical protein